MSEIKIANCTSPGCDQPGPSSCASCKVVGYCCRTCQVEDWSRHKEECQGHMRKVGMAHLQKAKGFDRDNNWVQTLRYSELALVKLKQLNDRPIEPIDDALTYKFNALNCMGQKRECLECAKELYCLYLTKHTHPPAIKAAFILIESCILNEEYEDAELYARTTWETITLSRDSHIPDAARRRFTAEGAHYLAKAMLGLAENVGIPLEANQTVGQEVIALARKALDIHTQLFGLEHRDVASDMSLLADALDHFHDFDDLEVIRLYEQSIAIHARVTGTSTTNVAGSEMNLAFAYLGRARRACAANDLDRYMTNLELSLLHLHDSARIYRTMNRVDKANEAAKYVVEIEEKIRQCTIARAATAESTAVATRG